MYKRFMSKSFIIVLAIVAVICAIPGSAFAAPGSPRILLVLDGIKGESVLKGYENAIDITSFSYGVEAASNFTSGAGASVGKPSYTEFNFTKSVDTATLALMQRIAQGTAIKQGTLYFIKDDSGKPYLTIKLQQIFVTGDQLSAEAGSGMSEELKLRAAQTTFTYAPQGPDGRLLPGQTLDINIPKGTVTAS
ncbi:type VI secretion system tube protein Hcp [Paenibacillus rhizovicinus]|uniref:Type VI secretion system tube protein Hcp n=1 Tax=Paenibacillus rhizovicinus TaxID=2704463 RepID=A0A6C0P1Q1_9BACL|nr:type VI secretion system tube protein Hcp [Paenibacillus rhizovicinus]QHW32395.1 type VI secretion system tube protein Hcp [Paenibacillus rhizovicinus]